MKNAWIIQPQNMKFSENAIYYFKKKIALNNPQKCVINITADARYKLTVNGRAVAFGPYKGTGVYHFYDTVDISSFLKAGENEFVAEVLQLSAETDFSQHRFLTSVPRTGNAAFLMWGSIEECDEAKTEIRTDGSWECAKADDISFIVPQYAYYGGINVQAGVGRELEWSGAKEAFFIGEILINGEIQLLHLKAHNLPRQKYERYSLTNRDSAGNYDFGRIVTGFVRVKLKGKGSIKLTYAECYSFSENGIDIKRDRTDTSGCIKGDFDIIEVDGEREFETFWFRTFRFIHIDGNAQIEQIEIMETGYPLSVKDDYDFGNATDNKLWDISVNTLKCCMHETYEDCPYYEQLQYAMDTYLQMLFTMKISDDTALIKRGINDLAMSASAGGITQSRAPSITPQYITGFSLYLIYMLDALEKNKGEHSFIKSYLGSVDSLITAFERRKRSDGLIGRDAYWSFVDWANGWEKEIGVPVSQKGDALTVYNLMYALALEKAARLFKIFGRAYAAEEYINNASEIKRLVKKKCYCEKTGLYADTNRKETFSQHTQVWAVLCELETGESAGRLLKKAAGLTARCGFAYAYYVFRAYEKAGIYEKCSDMMKLYRSLIDMHCTTIPEKPNNPRSECHGWGAALIYEFTSVVLGVKECDDCIYVKPYTADRSGAKGNVFTKHGEVLVDWSFCGDRLHISVKCRNDARIVLELPDGKKLSGVKKIEI